MAPACWTRSRCEDRKLFLAVLYHFAAVGPGPWLASGIEVPSDGAGVLDEIEVRRCFVFVVFLLLWGLALGLQAAHRVGVLDEIEVRLRCCVLLCVLRGLACKWHDWLASGTDVHCCGACCVWA